jgi:hypothetical protein
LGHWLGSCLASRRTRLTGAVRPSIWTEAVRCLCGNLA